jgi:hypothetical protein
MELLPQTTVAYTAHIKTQFDQGKTRTTPAHSYASRQQLPKISSANPSQQTMLMLPG